MTNQLSPKYETVPPLAQYVRENGTGLVPPPPQKATPEAKAKDFRVEAPPTLELPRKHLCPPRAITNQDGRGSCMIFTGARLFASEILRVSGIELDPSEEFLYALYLEAQGELCQDAGAYPQAVVDLLVKVGIVEEQVRPYLSTTLCDPPTPEQRVAAQMNRAVMYARCTTHEDIKAAIASDHHVVSCYTLTNSFFSPLRDQNGNFYFPQPTTGTYHHAMSYDGYDDDLVLPTGQGAYHMINQWGQFGDDRGGVWVSYAIHDQPDYTQGGPGCWKNELYTLIGHNGKVDPDNGPTPPPDGGYDRAVQITEGLVQSMSNLVASTKGSAKYKARMQLAGATSVLTTLRANR